MDKTPARQAPTEHPMRIEIKVPNVGESISQVEVAEWLKRRGDSVTKDETLLMV